MLNCNALSNSLSRTTLQEIKNLLQREDISGSNLTQ